MRSLSQNLDCLCQRGIVAITLLALVGCAAGPRVRVDRVTQAQYPPSSLVRTLDTPPAGSYVDLAHLSITGAPGEDRVQLMAALIKKASSLGANAIFITQEREESQNSGPIQFNPAGGNYITTSPKSILHIDAEALRLHESGNEHPDRP